MDDMEVIVWSDGTKPERSSKQDNPEHKSVVEVNYKAVSYTHLRAHET